MCHLFFVRLETLNSHLNNASLQFFLLVKFICRTTEKKQRHWLRSRSFKFFGGITRVFWAHKTHKLKIFSMIGLVVGFVPYIADGIMFTRSIAKLWKVWWYLPLSCKHYLVTLAELFPTFVGAIPHNRRSYSSQSKEPFLIFFLFVQNH